MCVCVCRKGVELQKDILHKANSNNTLKCKMENVAVSHTAEGTTLPLILFLAEPAAVAQCLSKRLTACANSADAARERMIFNSKLKTRHLGHRGGGAGCAP